MRSAFGDEAAPSLLEARHRPLRALHLLSGAMDRLPIDEKKKVEMDIEPEPEPGPEPEPEPEPEAEPEPEHQSQP